MILKKSVGSIALAAAIGLGALSVGVHAQNTAGDDRQMAQDRSGDMAARVKQALHSDSGLYDKHIDVSMEKGKVVMRGFVDSAGDLEKAVKAANKTAGANNVVNDLTIKRDDDLNDNIGK